MTDAPGGEQLREVQRLLTEKHADFLDEAQDVLRAGLQTSPWISVHALGLDPRGRHRRTACKTVCPS